MLNALPPITLCAYCAGGRHTGLCFSLIISICPSILMFLFFLLICFHFCEFLFLTSYPFGGQSQHTSNLSNVQKTFSRVKTGQFWPKHKKSLLRAKHLFVWGCYRHHMDRDWSFVRSSSSWGTAALTGRSPSLWRTDALCWCCWGPKETSWTLDPHCYCWGPLTYSEKERKFSCVNLV